jgi:dCTP diphosphatase
MKDLNDLRLALRAFAAEREWNQFHNPKNLAMAISIEAAEIMEHFQWASEQESLVLDNKRRERVGEELADVLMYTVRLADQLGIDLLAAAAAKMRVNAERYPAERVRGQAKKYDEYD